MYKVDVLEGWSNEERRQIVSVAEERSHFEKVFKSCVKDCGLENCGEEKE